MNSLFEKFYKKLRTEGLIKSAVCAAIACFAVNFLVAFITWFTEFDGLWLSIGLGLAAFAAAMPVFYFKLFRPDSKAVARRIDRIGLDERAITMEQFAGDESYIAQCQREDAVKAISAVDKSSIKFAFAIVPIVVACVLTVCGVGMTTVSALSSKYEALKPANIVKPEAYTYYEVVYDADEGGVIEGEAVQVVMAGDRTEAVTAVADDGWQFVGWSDELTSDPTRSEIVVNEDMEIIAIFQRVEASSGEDGEPGDGSDMPGDAEPDDTPMNGNNGDKNDNPLGGGKNEGLNNNIIDGTVDYTKIYGEYYNQAMAILQAGGELPAGLKQIMQTYFGMLLS